MLNLAKLSQFVGKGTRDLLALAMCVNEVRH